jgi:hypothetical protein
MSERRYTVLYLAFHSINKVISDRHLGYLSSIDFADNCSQFGTIINLLYLENHGIGPVVELAEVSSQAESLLVIVPASKQRPR